MRIEVKVEGLDECVARLVNKQKQVKYAAAVALTRGVAEGRRQTMFEMGQVFNRPTPWVLGSVRFVKATPYNLEAFVDFDQWGNKQGVTVSKVLKAEIFGGQRKNKRHEVALRNVGILPTGQAIVPGPGAKIDEYGNMQAGQIVQIISWFKGFGEQGYSANMRDGGKRLARGNKRTGQRGFAYFLLRRPHGKLPPGIYRRTSFGKLGSSVVAVMFFVALPKYRKLLKFYEVARIASTAEYYRQFPIALDEALRAAR